MQAWYLKISNAEFFLEDICSISSTSQCTQCGQVATVTAHRLDHKDTVFSARCRLLDTVNNLQDGIKNSNTVCSIPKHDLLSLQQCTLIPFSFSKIKNKQGHYFMYYIKCKMCPWVLLSAMCIRTDWDKAIKFGMVTNQLYKIIPTTSNAASLLSILNKSHR